MTKPTDKKNGQLGVVKLHEAPKPTAASEPVAHKISEEAQVAIRSLNEAIGVAERTLASATMRRFQAEAEEQTAASALQQASAAYQSRVLEAAKTIGLDVDKRRWLFDLPSASFTEQ